MNPKIGQIVRYTAGSLMSYAFLVTELNRDGTVNGVVFGLPGSPVTLENFVRRGNGRVPGTWRRGRRGEME